MPGLQKDHGLHKLVFMSGIVPEGTDVGYYALPCSYMAIYGVRRMRYLVFCTKRNLVLPVLLKRSIRIATAPQGAFGGCALCKLHEFGKKEFSQQTVLLYDQCGREYHVECLKEHNMADLTKVVSWCSPRNHLIYYPSYDRASPYSSHGLWDKRKESRLIRALLKNMIISGLQNFDRSNIASVVTAADKVTADLVNRKACKQTAGKTVVFAGLFCVIGSEAAKLPLVAMSRDNHGLGYFDGLFACIERLLSSLKVKHFVLPETDEAASICMQWFGFRKVTYDKLLEHLKGGCTTVLHGTSTQHKLVPVVEAGARGLRRRKRRRQHPRTEELVFSFWRGWIDGVM
ncbi:hypothetical protein ZWY2020_030925 [Hordeum vulgare]|nr:hypothetical protein ZWY2020_030925 [Hordeum vulgare]